MIAGKRHLLPVICCTLLLLGTLTGCRNSDRMLPSLSEEVEGRLIYFLDSIADVDVERADSVLIALHSRLSTASSTPSPASHFSHITHHSFLLLRIKIDDKLYRPITHYRDTILQIVDYFEHTSPHLSLITNHSSPLPPSWGRKGLATAYLYAGRVFADLGDAPQALDYYQRALDALPEANEGKVESSRLYKQRGLLLSLIAEQFFYQGLHSEALSSLKEANNWANLANDTVDMIFNLRDIAEQYKFLETIDTSLFYYQKALDLSVKYGDEKRENDILSQLSALCLQKGEIKLAKAYILKPLSNLDSANISAVYNIASKVYRHEGNIDSAQIFYKGLLKYGNIYGRRNAYRELSEFAMKHNDFRRATDYFQEYKKLDDSIRDLDNAETIAKMHAAYNYRIHERKAKELELSNAKKQNTINIASIIILLLIVGIYLYIREEKKKKTLLNQKLEVLNKKIIEYKKGRNPEVWVNKVKEYENNINKLQTLIIQNNEEYDVEKASLLSQIFKLRDEKKSLELSIQRASNRIKDADLTISTFVGTAIYKTLLQKAYNKEVVSNEEWSLFINQAEESYFPDFRINITALCKVSEQEYRMCLLFKSGFSKTHVATLLLVDRSAVSHAFERLYLKATKRKGKAKDWEEILSSI